MEDDDAPPPKRPPGKPRGSYCRLSTEAIKAAKATGNGLLPHEILLSIARGEVQSVLVIQSDGTVEEEHYVPSFEEVRDAAKAAAPYYAPKISAVEVTGGLSDADLDQFIAGLAAETGISLGADGTPKAAQTPAGPADGGTRPNAERGEGGPVFNPDRIRKRPVTGT